MVLQCTHAMLIQPNLVLTSDLLVDLQCTNVWLSLCTCIDLFMPDLMFLTANRLGNAYVIVIFLETKLLISKLPLLLFSLPFFLPILILISCFVPFSLLTFNIIYLTFLWYLCVTYLRLNFISIAKTIKYTVNK